VNLHAIVYVSSATRLPDESTITHLLQRARQRNLEHGVTGLLLYADGSFMQYIEGPQAGLTVVYNVIRRDALHHSLIELLNEPVGEREFADWTMAYSADTLPPFLRPQPRGKRAAAQPLLGTGHQLLQTVWREARRRLS